MAGRQVGEGSWERPGSDSGSEVIKFQGQSSSPQAAPQGPKDPDQYHTLLWESAPSRGRIQKGREGSPEKNSLYNTVTLVPNCSQVLRGVAGGADQTGSQTLLVFLLAAVSRAEQREP